MAESRDNLIDAVLEQYRRFARAMQRASEPFWRELDLTMAQLRTLFTLAHEGSASIGQVAEAQRVSLPTASHLVERLVQAGLATREEDPADRRRMVVRLTPAGEELVNKIRHGGDRQLRGWLGHLSYDDIAALLRGMTALAVTAERHAPPRDCGEGEGRPPPGPARPLAAAQRTSAETEESED